MEITQTKGIYASGQIPEKLVYLVTEDVRFAAYISEQIVHFGYSVQKIPDIKSLSNLIADRNCVAIAIDIPITKNQPSETDVFLEMSLLGSTFNNLIFISDQDDQVVRLKSIQAGGVAFFLKPVNIVSFIDKLDSMSRYDIADQPSKVLIIEDQPAVANYYQMVLKMSGLNAQIAPTPNAVLDQMREFHPDLILMNTFLSETTAADLAKVIRQIDEFVSIPIIFLSNDDDFRKRIEALDLGGDDFLVKPIKASHLTSVVRSRLERSNTLRSYMVRDSLTNLYNHTAFRSALTQEVYRCQRQNCKLALAMLDIDHFKTVNDNYGHATGDSVLKGLARLLQQRLRRSDLVGRYGGDEFVALLLDCPVESAVRIMDEIRLHFSEIEFTPVKGKTLSLTFSCGIATFPRFQSAESLSDAADQALYLSKSGTRNRVTVLP